MKGTIPERVITQNYVAIVDVVGVYVEHEVGESENMVNARYAR